MGKLGKGAGGFDGKTPPPANGGGGGVEGVDVPAEEPIDNGLEGAAPPGAEELLPTRRICKGAEIGKAPGYAPHWSRDMLPTRSATASRYCLAYQRRTLVIRRYDEINNWRLPFFVIDFRGADFMIQNV